MNPGTPIDQVIRVLDNVGALLAGSLERQDFGGVRIAAELIRDAIIYNRSLGMGWMRGGVRPGTVAQTRAHVHRAASGAACRTRPVVLEFLGWPVLIPGVVGPHELFHLPYWPGPGCTGSSSSIACGTVPPRRGDVSAVTQAADRSGTRSIPSASSHFLRSFLMTRLPASRRCRLVGKGTQRWASVTPHWAVCACRGRMHRAVATRTRTDLFPRPRNGRSRGAGRGQDRPG
jgi:hypothetical protein